jgi:glycosyltransferase involved in cell wall biosynthesis
VYTGTFGLINGVDYMVNIADAMRSIAPDVRFLLVGQGAEAEKIKHHAQALGVLNRNLWIWSAVPKQNMPDLLAAATVATSFVIPLQALWHNSANKFFDALAASKPIAINHGGWQAELLKQTGAGIVLPADDPTQAARQLAAFVHAPQRLQQAGVAARRLAHDEFHRDVLAAKLEHVLMQAVTTRSRDPKAASQSR